MGQFEDIVYMRIASKTFDDINRQCEVFSQYYKIENGEAFHVYVPPYPDIISFDQINQMSEVLLTDPEKNKINTDLIEEAFLIGALNIIDQNSTLGTTASDWEIIDISDSPETHLFKHLS